MVLPRSDVFHASFPFRARLSLAFSARKLPVREYTAYSCDEKLGRGSQSCLLAKAVQDICSPCETQHRCSTTSYLIYRQSFLALHLFLISHSLSWPFVPISCCISHRGHDDGSNPFYRPLRLLHISLKIPWLKISTTFILQTNDSIHQRFRALRNADMSR